MITNTVRILRLLGFGILGLLLISLLTLSYLTVSFEPNDYRDELESLVSERTGRAFVLGSDLELHLDLPQVGFEVHEAALDNASGFGQEPMLTVQRAEIYLRPIQLLFGRLHIHSIRLDGLQLRLHRSSSGSTNWLALTRPIVNAPRRVLRSDGKTNSPISLKAPSLQLTDSTIAFWDDLNEQRVRLSNLNLNLGALPLSNAIKVSMDSELMLWLDASQENRVNADIQMDSELQWDAAQQTLDGQDLNLELRLAGPAFAFEQLEGTFGTRSFRWNRNDDTLEATDVHANTLGAEFRMEHINLQELSREMKASGHIRGDGINIPQWLELWQIEYPKETPEILHTLALAGNFQAHSHGVNIWELGAQFNNTHIQGDLSILDPDQPRLAAHLQLDQLALDAYLPQEQAPTPDAEGTDAVADAVAMSPIFPPVNWLREQRLDVQLEIGRLDWRGLSVEHPRLKLIANNGLWNLEEFTGALNNGSFQADAQLDATSGIPEYELNLKLSRLELGALLARTLELERSPIEGATNLELALNARGLQANTFLPSLRGFIGVSLLNGSLQIGEVVSAIEGAVAALQKRPQQSTHEGRLLFDHLSANWNATDGRLLNHDLKLVAGAINVTGQGHVDLPASNLEYQLNVGSGDSVRIPVRISGSFDNLSHSLDLSALTNIEINEGLEKLKKKTEELVEEKTKEELADEAEDSVRNLLELF